MLKNIKLRVDETNEVEVLQHQREYGNATNIGIETLNPVIGGRSVPLKGVLCDKTFGAIWPLSS